MLCPRCGEANAYGARFCVRCGAPLPVEPQPPAATPAAAPPAPGITAPGLSPPKVVLQPLSPPRPLGPPENSGKAIASLICGFFMWIFPAAVAAIILGHVSLSEINGSAGRLRGRGMAIAGLVLGYCGIFVIPVILIVAAIAIPNLLRVRLAANEASAVGSLTAIDTAAVTYSATYGNGFPPNLISMDGAGTRRPTCDHAQLIGLRLASGLKDGYTFTYVPTGYAASNAQTLSDKAKAAGCTVPGTSAFEVHADPITRGTTGERSFYSDQTGVIRAARGGPASADSPPIE